MFIFQLSKKIFFMLLIFPLTVFAYTARCPTPAEIKNGELGFWLPLYIVGEELISDADEKLFKSAVQQFHFAEWNPDFLESGHCFYLGSDAIIAKIVLAQDAFRPAPEPVWIWYKKSHAARCFESTSNCWFVK